MDQMQNQLAENNIRVIDGGEAIRKELVWLDNHTYRVVHGSLLNVLYVVKVVDTGFLCANTKAMGTSDVYQVVPFCQLPREQESVLLVNRIIFFDGQDVFIPSRVAITQICKRLKMGATGDIFRIGASWVELAFLLQRAILESKDVWVSIIREEGNMLRLLSAVSKKAPVHNWRLMRQICTIPAKMTGVFMDQVVQLRIETPRGPLIVMDSVSGQSSFRVYFENGGDIIHRDHKTEITNEERWDLYETVSSCVLSLQLKTAR